MRLECSLLVTICACWQQTREQAISLYTIPYIFHMHMNSIALYANRISCMHFTNLTWKLKQNRTISPFAAPNQNKCRISSNGVCSIKTYSVGKEMSAEQADMFTLKVNNLSCFEPDTCNAAILGLLWCTQIYPI